MKHASACLAIAAALTLGFASGLPFNLPDSTLQAWLAVEGVDIVTIGWFALVGQPYIYKFLWAPLVEKFIAEARRTRSRPVFYQVSADFLPVAVDMRLQALKLGEQAVVDLRVGQDEHAAGQGAAASAGTASSPRDAPCARDRYAVASCTRTESSSA